VAVDPVSRDVFVADSSDNTFSVLNESTNDVSKVFAAGNGPADVAIDPGRNVTYVADKNDNALSVRDATTGSPAASIAVGTAPTAVDVNTTTGAVYVANGGGSSLSVVAGTPPIVVATVTLGSNPNGVAVDSSRNVIYVTGGDGTVSVVDGASNRVQSTIDVGANPTGIAVDQATDTIYVANYSDGTVSVINGATQAVMATVPVGTDPTGVAVDASRGAVYVSNYADDTISAIDVATNTVVATIPVGSHPSGLGVNTGNGSIYVANYSEGTVSVIDGATSSVAATTAVGPTPYAIAVDTRSDTIAVADIGAGTISLLNGATPPSAPKIESSSPANRKIVVTWRAPSATSPTIDSYVVTAASSGQPVMTTVPGNVSGAALTGLDNGTTYRITVTPVSATGPGTASAAVDLTPRATPPSAPTVPTGTAGNGSISVAWVTPATGDSPILYFAVSAIGGGASTTQLVQATKTSASFAHLTNGVAYSVSVVAVSASGPSDSSPPLVITPATVPGVPWGLKATASRSTVTLSWHAPSSSGGSPVLGYWIYRGAKSGHESSTPINGQLVTKRSVVVTGLKRRSNYYFVVVAVNASGSSVRSKEVRARTN